MTLILVALSSLWEWRFEENRVQQREELKGQTEAFVEMLEQRKQPSNITNPFYG
jgi:hypothetical protein